MTPHKSIFLHYVAHKADYFFKILQIVLVKAIHGIYYNSIVQNLYKSKRICFWIFIFNTLMIKYFNIYEINEITFPKK